MNCLIVDDEPLAIDVVESFVQKVPYLNLIGTCTNAFDALKLMQNGNIDLLFLDIQMPNVTGIDLVKSINNQPLIIFTTAYSSYAIDGFNLNAIDYLIKPIPFERFFKAVNKANDYFQSQIKHVENNDENNTDETLVGKYIMVKADYSQIKIDLENILYIEGLKDYLKIFIKDEKPILTLNSLKKYEDYLPSEYFARVHRSYIVSLAKIDAIQKHRIVIGKERIPIGDNYKAEFYKKIEGNSI